MPAISIHLTFGKFISTQRVHAYATTLTTNPKSIPKSPVPFCAIGPVNHCCCIVSTINTTATASVHSAGYGRGRFGWRGLSHAANTSYAAYVRLKRTCSVMTMAQNGASQYPMSAAGEVT